MGIGRDSCSSDESYRTLMTNIPAESVLDVDMGIMARERLSNEWGSPAIPASEAGSVDYPQSFRSGLSVPSVAPVGSTRSWSSKPRDSMEELKGMMENILKIMDKKERRKAMNITQSRSPRSIKSAQQSKPSWKKTLRSNAISERSAPRDLKKPEGHQGRQACDPSHSWPAIPEVEEEPGCSRDLTALQTSGLEQGELEAQGYQRGFWTEAHVLSWLE